MYQGDQEAWKSRPKANLPRFRKCPPEMEPSWQKKTAPHTVIKSRPRRCPGKRLIRPKAALRQWNLPRRHRLPRAGLAVQSPSKSGMRIAQNINASEPPSQNKPAEPPAEKDIADRAKEKSASADELLVVRCEITPEALKNHAFDKILADNAIVWSKRGKKRRKKIWILINRPIRKRSIRFSAHNPTVRQSSRG